MAEIPYFPRIELEWPVNRHELPTITTLEELIEALTHIKEQEPEAARLNIIHLYLGIYRDGYQEINIQLTAEGMETDAEYSERFEEAQEKLADAGVTYKFMQRTLTKVDKALEKLEGS